MAWIGGSMQPRNNPRPPQRRTDYVSSYASYLNDERNAVRIQQQQRQHLLRRIRRLARVAVVATKTNTTSKQRRLLAYKRRVVYGLRQVHDNQYRLVAGTFLLVFASSTVVTPLLQARDPKPITLDSQVQKLVGDTRDDLKDNLKYDAEKREYSFEIPSAESSAENLKHTGRNADAYTTTLPQNASDGVTVTEKKTNIAVTLKPEFFTAHARKSEGNHVVYRSGTEQLIYTHKYNGLKEDIIVPKFKGGELNYRFTLELPAGVDARLDDDGNIGIYSGDSSLFGNISYGTEEDREKVEKARQHSEKTNLVMTIPYPIVKDSTGTEFTDKAEFVLGTPTQVQQKPTQKVDPDLPEEVQSAMSKNNTIQRYSLELKAYNLAQLSYPISIDPTMQVTSSADFNKLNLEGGAEIDTTNNLIKRTALTGGAIGGWTTDADTLPGDGATKMAGAYYKGRLYVQGGFNQNPGEVHNNSTLYMATIHPTTGDIGAWTPAGSGFVGHSTHNLMFYNGYVYQTGSSAGATGLVSYAKVNDDGTVGTVQTTSAYTPGRRFAQATIHNGYLYITGGCSAFGNILDNQDCTTWHADILYAKLQADGTLSAFASAGANFTQSRGSHNLVGNNGTLYLFGGANDDGPSYDWRQVQMTRINSNGTISTWTATTSMPASSPSSGAVIHNGYLYVISSVVRYAPVYASGSIGVWQTSTLYNGSSRSEAVLIAANNFLYFGTGITFGSPNDYHNNFQYTSIRPAGWVTPFTTSTVLPQARQGISSVAHNGYIYVIGGNSGATFYNTVLFAPLNSNGSIGSWTTSTRTFLTGRSATTATVANGYLYIMGGGTQLLGLLPETLYAPIGNSGEFTADFTVATNSFSTARVNATSQVLNNYLYIIGGKSSSAVLGDVQYSQLNPTSGAPGTFTATSEIYLRWALASATHSGYLYAAGGADCATGSTCNTSVIQYAKPNSDGTIPASGAGSWTYTTSLSGPGLTPSFAINKGVAYLFGSSIETGVDMAAVNADGTIGAWTDTISNLSVGRYYQGYAVYNGFAYVLGGNDNSVDRNVTEYAQINNGGPGTIGPVATSQPSFATARFTHTSWTYNNYLYVAGGCSDAGCAGFYLSDVQVTKIQADGTFTSPNLSGCSGATWCTTTSLTYSRRYLESTVVNGRVYIADGVLSNGSGNNGVQYAAMNSDGSLSSWTTVTGYGGTGRYGFGFSELNGYLYVMGGVNNSSSVRYSKLVSGGGIAIDAGCGTEWCDGTSLPAGRVLLNATSYRGYLYIVGGCDAICSSDSLTTLYIKPNANGSLGTWLASTALTTGRQDSELATINGFMYVMGGSGVSGGRRTYAEFAPILVSGALASWESAGGMTSRQYMSAAVSGPSIYLLGGCTDAGCPRNDVVSYTSSSIPRKASVSKLYDFDVGVRPSRLITRGTKQLGSTTSVSYGSTNNMGTTLDNFQSIFDTGYSGSSAQTLSLGSNRTLSRYILLRYTIDDSQSAVFPDSGNESTITDWDVYYTANPGSRLKGGRTFTNGVDRGLEANPQ